MIFFAFPIAFQKVMLYSGVQKTNNAYRFDMVFNKKVMKNRGDTIMKEKVVLAYSGGLDTTAVIP